MSIGTSGRIVIEVEPEVKRHLYSALAREGLTLKQWFLREARIYVANTQQMRCDIGNGNIAVKQLENPEICRSNVP